MALRLEVESSGRCPTNFSLSTSGCHADKLMSFGRSDQDTTRIIHGSRALSKRARMIRENGSNANHRNLSKHSGRIELRGFAVRVRAHNRMRSQMQLVRLGVHLHWRVDDDARPDHGRSRKVQL